ncbi:MAG: hybrid sensor histidine kinase/response regulator [Planctomycetaceae bacterium]
MWDFLSRLFDTTGFPPRWKCGAWSAGHGWLHIAADLGVWSAYLTIPCVLAYFAARRRDLPFRRLFWLFGAFILACGTTHLVEALLFWWPAYRLSGAIKLLTALVSWATVVALIPAVPRALALRAPQELESEVARRRRVEDELRKMHEQLERRVADRTAELSSVNAALQSEIAVRERFEQALASAREWFEVTLASIGDAVIVTDTEGRVTFLNEMARQLTGRREDVRGHPSHKVFCIVDEASGETAESPIDQVLATGSISNISDRTQLVSADGTRRPIDDSAAPIRNAQGDMLGVVLVFRDVTERRQAEAALRRSEGRYRALVQATSQIVWTTDPAGQVAEDSPSWRMFTGQTYEQWKGSGWLDALHPDDRQATARAWEVAVASQAPYVVEYRLRAAKGDYRFTEARAVPVLDSEGRIAEWIGMNVDVTERRNATDALHEADRRKDHFLAMLGHELRNPLAGITGAIQVLRRVERGTPEAGEMQRIIERQTRHMSRIIDDLLEVSRISRGKIQIRKAPLDLRLLLGQITEDLQPLLTDARLELLLQTPETPVYILADATRIGQVFVNLLQNAVKFTNAGGLVTLRLERDAQLGQAVVTVSDTGIGMSAATLARVFEPFSQADSSFDRGQVGLGLGLALVKGLVELHGGSTQASSAGAGCGSQFTVRLPLSEPLAAGPASRPEPVSPPAALRILIIDDQRDASYPLQKLLELEGHEVAVASDGPTGLEMAQRLLPHVVLCDIGLPGSMSGHAVARALRNDQRTSSAVLVAVTGYGQEEDRRRALAAGFDRHLTKPVAQTELRNVFAELLPHEQN